MGDEGRTDYKYPKYLKLTIAVFYLGNYFKSTDQGTINRARDMLSDHNIELDVWPSLGKKHGYNTIPFGDRLVGPDDYSPLRKEIARILKERHCPFVIPLPVLYCNFHGAAHGLTIHSTPGLTALILISPVVNADKVTLLHEMGHAAGMSHDKHSTDSKHRNFMHEADTRTTIYKWQVQKFAKAKFAVG